MLRVIGCVTTMHDLRLVLLACVICSLASLTTLHILARAQAANGRALLGWVAAGGLAFGSGVWSTHFVSMLAYRPNMPIAFDVGPTILSLLWAIGGGWLATCVAAYSTRRSAVAAGVLFGAAIGAMHFTGMSALQMPGIITYDTHVVAAAWVLGLLFAPMSILQMRAGRIWLAALLMMLAVTGLHFTAMAAVMLAPGGASVRGLPTLSLAVVVTAIGVLILLASLGAALLARHLDQRSAQETARFQRFANATFEGLFFLENGIVTDANLVLCGMLCRASTEMVGQPLSAFFAETSYVAVAAMQRGGVGHAEVELLVAGNAPRIVDILSRPFADDFAEGTIIAVRDATARKHAERRIYELAHTDSLTGLANRARLNERLKEAIANAAHGGTAVGILCLDLDRFKLVNDIQGHQAGDALLAAVAVRLRARTREGQTIARLGGDEFVVVQPFAGHPEEVVSLARRLTEDLAAPYMIDGRLVNVSASIGVSLYPAEAPDADALLRQADLALYRAKHEGRACYRIYQPAMDRHLRARREMEQDLRQALAKGEFSLRYQPVFEGENLSLAGYEALLWWHHPARGRVLPSEFIPLAEECGAIRAIGEWVLQTACAEAATWPDSLTLAVNLSAEQFKDQQLATHIASALTKSGLPAHQLELEVTESVMIGDAGRALAVLGSLKAQGIRIAMDDFGTGYSSLSYLRRFPFDRLKIDRSFVAELGVNPDADAIIHCIIDMAHSLRLGVTAEGVETERQLSLLRGMRCGHLQGFLLGRPMLATSLPCHTAEVVAA